MQALVVEPVDVLRVLDLEVDDILPRPLVPTSSALKSE